MNYPKLSFSVATYQISSVLQDDFVLAEYAGSMLRGVYGNSLRKISCMTGQKKCDNCPIITTCPYPELFDPAKDMTHMGRNVKSIPAPYVIQAPAWGAKELKKGDELSFNIRLFGVSSHRTPFVFHSFRQALYHGIGRKPNKASAVVSNICHLETKQNLFDDEGNFVQHTPSIPKIDISNCPTNIRIEFKTPYRSQIQGKPISVKDITPRRLVTDIIRRARLLIEFYGDASDITNWPIDEWLAMADNIKNTKELYWQDWKRYSNRQRRSMRLGGLMGKWYWQDVPTEIAAILKIGSIIHVGKQTVFGFGHMDGSYTS